MALECCGTNTEIVVLANVVRNLIELFIENCFSTATKKTIGI
jgi:hypothetical protein